MGPYNCNKCQLKYPTMYLLKKHFSTEHDIQVKNIPQTCKQNASRVDPIIKEGE